MTMRRPKNSLGKITLFSLIVMGLVLSTGYGKEELFRFDSFAGETVAVERQPVFIITSHSDNDLKETLRCATLASAKQDAFWIINFAWEQSSEVKRRIASKLMKEDFMKARSTVLGPEYRTAARMILVEASGRIHWSCDSFPSNKEWSQALSIWTRLADNLRQKSL